MPQSKIAKLDAADASRSAFDLVHEIQTLNEVAELVRYGDDSGDDIAQNQLLVLQNIINEKSHELFHAVDFVDDYFNQKSKPQKKTAKAS